MSDERFQVFDSLQRHNTRLRDSTRLGNGVGLASCYNEQDLIDLEDQLKSNFDSMGDTILFLQRKQTDADPARLSLDAGELDVG